MFILEKECRTKKLFVLLEGVEKQVRKDLSVLRAEVDARVNIFLLTKLEEDFEGIMPNLKKIRVAGRSLGRLWRSFGICTIAFHNFAPSSQAIL